MAEGAATERSSLRSFFSGIKSASIPTRIGGLDELRGIAILVVMFAHGAGIIGGIPDRVTSYGVQGVYLFFSISGYLITRILLDETEKGEPLSHFFIRRFLRIWPLMLAALVASALLYPATRNALAYNLVLMNNYAMAGGMQAPFATDVMWSLAIEEQFYLVWPFVVLLLGRKYLPYAIALIVFVGFAYEAQLFPSPEGYNIRHATHGAMQYLALGAAIALGPRGMIPAIVAAVAVFCVTFGVNGLPAFRPVWFGVTVLCYAATYLTIHLMPLFRFQPLAHIGKLCYGLYLIHFFVRELTSNLLPHGWFGLGIYLAISYVLAIASLYLFEAPILRTRKFFERSAKGQAMLALFVAVTVIGALAFLTQQAASATVQKVAAATSRKEQFASCAGVFLALGGDGSPWQNDYYGALSRLEKDEGVEFSQRVELARISAEAWSARPAADQAAKAAECRSLLESH